VFKKYFYIRKIKRRSGSILLRRETDRVAVAWMCMYPCSGRLSDR